MLIDKNNKVNANTGKSYVTLQEGIDFRKIARIMSNNGFQMNHATARNQLIQAVEKVIAHTAGELGLNLSKEQLTDMAKSQEMHDALQDVLYLAHRKKKETTA